MKINNLYFSLCDDVGENKGGFFVEVYNDEDCTIQVDNFVIPANDVNSNFDMALKWIEKYYI